MKNGSSLHVNWLAIIGISITFILVSAFSGTHGVIEIPEGGPPQVSVFHLLFDGEKYVGRNVVVSGYLGIYGGSAALYPTKEDALMQNAPLGLMIYDPKLPELLDRCVNHFVSVEGIFRIRPAGYHVFETVKSVDTYVFGKPWEFQSQCYVRPFEEGETTKP